MPWTSKTKNSGNTPTYKAKIATKFELGRIVTPDSLEILVGASEDLVLIYQDEESFWDNPKLKTTGGVWSQKTKTPVV